MSWGGAPPGIRIGVTNPGRYRVRFPSIDGYEAIPPQELTVTAGTTELRIDLVKEQRGAGAVGVGGDHSLREFYSPAYSKL